MKKIPPSGSSHHGNGFAPSSSGYSFGGVHDSHPPPHAPALPDFKPISPPSHYHSHKPSYGDFIKGVFSASSSPVVKPAHSSPPLSHPYHETSSPHSHHGPSSHITSYSSSHTLSHPSSPSSSSSVSYSSSHPSSHSSGYYLSHPPSHSSGFSPSHPPSHSSGFSSSHPPSHSSSYPSSHPPSHSSSYSESYSSSYPQSHPSSHSSSFSSSYPPSHPSSHPPNDPSSHPPMEYDYNPSLSKFPTSSGPDTSFGPTSSHVMQPTSSEYGPPTGGAPLNVPPSTNYGYPVGNIDYKQNSPTFGQSDSQHSAQTVQAHVDTYQKQPETPSQAPQVPPAQIHITPMTNFIEYTNIQNTDPQQSQHHPQPAQGHQNSQATSQQVAEEVIKYLGNLQQGGNRGGDQSGDPQLFFGVNLPLGGANGGGEVQDESFPLYPPGTNHQDSAGGHIFMPTPLPPDNAPNSYAPSGGEFSGEQIPPVYSQSSNSQYSVDSYGNPIQVSKSLLKNHKRNQHQTGHVKFLKPQPSPPNHHYNGVTTQNRHKTKPEFEIVRSVSFELGAPGPVIHH